MDDKEISGLCVRFGLCIRLRGHPWPFESTCGAFHKAWRSAAWSRSPYCGSSMQQHMWILTQNRAARPHPANAGNNGIEQGWEETNATSQTFQGSRKHGGNCRRPPVPAHCIVVLHEGPGNAWIATCFRLRLVGIVKQRRCMRRGPIISLVHKLAMQLAMCNRA